MYKSNLWNCTLCFYYNINRLSKASMIGNLGLVIDLNWFPQKGTTIEKEPSKRNNYQLISYALL